MFCLKLISGAQAFYQTYHWFKAPEVVAGQPYEPVADWWHLGAYMYEMLTGNTISHSEGKVQLSYNMSPEASSLLKQVFVPQCLLSFQLTLVCCHRVTQSQSPFILFLCVWQSGTY